MKIHVTINDEAYDRDVPEHRTLLEFLREDVGATGTKEGCAAGECGACTVILDGDAVNACMVLAVEVDGRTIRTIEGEATATALSDLQAAFARHHSVQCGFCTPGMLMSLRSLLDDTPSPDLEEIKGRIEGNFCRCTGYQQIIEAVLDVTGQLDDDNQGVLRHV